MPFMVFGKGKTTPPDFNYLGDPFIHCFEYLPDAALHYGKFHRYRYFRVECTGYTKRVTRFVGNHIMCSGYRVLEEVCPIRDQHLMNGRFEYSDCVVYRMDGVIHREDNQAALEFRDGR